MACVGHSEEWPSFKPLFAMTTSQVLSKNYAYHTPKQKLVKRASFLRPCGETRRFLSAFGGSSKPCGFGYWPW